MRTFILWLMHFVRRNILWFVGTALGVLILIVALNVSVVVTSRNFIFDDIAGLPIGEAGLLLGAGVFESGALSDVLKERADAAVLLYHAKKISKILVSGDNNTPQYNEVSPVRLYLIEKGVREEDIFLDYAGFDTYDSIYRARSIFKVSSVTIISQRYYLPRAVFIAHALGLQAYGFSADDAENQLKRPVGERLATVKSSLEILFHSKPAFLGEAVPISGAGPQSIE